jgi:hypothetical protein
MAESMGHRARGQKSEVGSQTTVDSNWILRICLVPCALSLEPVAKEMSDTTTDDHQQTTDSIAIS